MKFLNLCEKLFKNNLTVKTFVCTNSKMIVVSDELLKTISGGITFGLLSFSTAIP